MIEGMSTPVIYLHGYSGDKDGLKGIALALDEQPYYLLELPGFGQSPDPPHDALIDILRYTDCVWERIRSEVPSGRVRLVGHSHGAMVAFALASRHSEYVETLTLLCPVAKPRLPAKMLVWGLQFGRHLLGYKGVIWLASRRWFVDLVSFYSMQRNWTKEIRARIYRIRRREAKLYRPSNIEMMTQALHFKDEMDKVRVDVPTTICYAKNDIVAGKQDARWFETRCSAGARMINVRGGHLVVMGEPDYVANALTHAAEGGAKGAA